MEERHIEAEYDAWVTYIEDRQRKLDDRLNDLFKELIAIDPDQDFNTITRKYSLSQVFIYLQHGGDKEVALQDLMRSVK